MSRGNVYRSGSLADLFSTFHFSGSTFVGGGVSLSGAQSGASGFSANDIFQTAPIGFANIGGTCDMDGNAAVGDCAFHLPGGSAVDAGQCAFVTTNSGTASAGPVNVINNAALASDPGLYFRSPASYRTAVGDNVVVGPSAGVVFSTTPNSITLLSPITWTSGQC